MSDTMEGQALEVSDVRPAPLALVPQTDASELVARLRVIQDAADKAMVESVDYGKIPGISKPTLLKPGAEKLGVLFQLDVQIQNSMTWHDDGHLTVVSHAIVFHAPTGTRVASGEGVCTTREAKYAWRTQDRTCPSCGSETIKKSKYPPRGAPRGTPPGWYCYAKIGGCGAEFGADDPEITGQTTGRTPNPDLPDTYNTVTKMASKRARIDAILAATGASALFTQDVEDAPRQETPDVKPNSEPSPLVADVEAGIARLGGDDPGWTLTGVLESASSSFGRKIRKLDQLSDDELGQILAAMPTESPPQP